MSARIRQRAPHSLAETTNDNDQKGGHGTWCSKLIGSGNELTGELGQAAIAPLAGADHTLLHCGGATLPTRKQLGEIPHMRPGYPDGHLLMTGHGDEC